MTSLREVRARIAADGRLTAAAFSWRCDRGLTAALAGIALLAGLLPNLLIIAMALLVGQAAALAGGRVGALAGPVALAGAAYGVSLLLVPVRDAVDRTSRIQQTYALQRRIMTLVSSPTGTGHLDDRKVAGRLQLAQGALSSFYPADAPGTLARVTGTRLSGLGAVIIVATFRWWLGLGLLAAWLVIRWRIRAVIVADVSSMAGEVSVMRHADYLRGLATDRSAARELRVFGASEWVIAAFRSTWTAALAIRWATRRRLYRSVLIATGAVLALYAGGFWLIADAASAGRLTLARAVLFTIAVPATAAAGSISFDDIGLEWMVSSLRELTGVERDLARGQAPPPSGQRLSAGAPRREIRLTAVRFRYPGGDRDVLTGLDLVIPAGLTTAIVGMNGAGKSTIIRLLSCQHEPTGGRITVDGQDLRALEPARWRRQLAVVFQDSVRYPVSLADNIAFGDVTRLTGDSVRAAAADAGVADLWGTLPDGQDTDLSPGSGTGLSGGQWQRIAIARALYALRGGASVLIMDEPTAALDADAEADFLARLADATPGVTKVLISHRLSGVRRADQIVVIDTGQVTERGEHLSLMAANGPYAAMFRQQAASYQGSPSGGAQ